jgi:hypothetical protein
LAYNYKRVRNLCKILSAIKANITNTDNLEYMRERIYKKYPFIWSIKINISENHRTAINRADNTDNAISDLIMFFIENK